MPEAPDPSEFPIEPGSRADLDIVPIFFCKAPEPPEPPTILSFSGTGFRLGRELLVTCWHCLAEERREGHGYAVALKDDGRNYRMHPLVDVSQDINGSDLATARIFDVTAPPTLGLILSDVAAAGGANVGTWGYPLTAITDQRQFMLNARWLEGYITRSFWYDHPRFGRTSSYEVDMPAPDGLSGAPLLALPGRRVIGVVYGTHDVARVEEFASVTEEGERQPEVQRIVSFALASYTSTLSDLAGSATEGLALSEYFRRASQAD